VDSRLISRSSSRESGSYKASVSWHFTSRTEPQTAPVALREKVAFSEDRPGGRVAHLDAGKRPSRGGDPVHVQPNRALLVGDRQPLESQQWLERHHGKNLSLTSSLLSIRNSGGRACLQRRLGSDSMVLGEAQILGQLKDAYRVAQETGSTGTPRPNKLF